MATQKIVHNIEATTHARRITAVSREIASWRYSAYRSAGAMVRRSSCYSL